MNETLERLRREWPDATFLALGQTALWDEPVKAALRLRLDAFWPEATIVAGVHDSDYFAKLPGHPAAARQKFALVSHDDNATRGLWSAAGEMSQLFGSEDVATRNLLKRDGGVSLHHALAFTENPDETLGDLTRAWGWRGIIQGGWKKSVTAEIPLREILPTLREQLCWAIDGSADRLEGRWEEAGHKLCRELISRIDAFSESHPSATLTDLYRDLLPHFYEQLLGAPAQNLETTQTTELLKLTPETASLPRFAFVNAFLNPKTRKSAEDAYNLALGGGDIYTLDHFGEGAIPFDAIVAGQGRGTLHVTPTEIRIDAPRAIVVPGTATSVKELAEKLAHLGEITLVGKAVSLLPMLAAEFVLVFHEGASSYSGRTKALTEEMARRGIPLPKLRPILRVEYKTWDALRAVPCADSTVVTLPEFLRQALNREKITLMDFAICWPRAVEWETARLNALKPLRPPRALLAHLARTLGGAWVEKAAEHEALTEKLVGLYGGTVALKERELAERAALKARRAEIAARYHAKGEAFRAGEDRSRLDARISALHAEIERLVSEAHALHLERKDAERGVELSVTRTAVRQIEAEAERERARQTRNALQTIHGLPHTDHRPSAWWFPLLDPSGAWLREVARTAHFYLEPLA